MPDTVESSQVDDGWVGLRIVTVEPPSDAAIAARNPATLLPMMTVSHACMSSPNGSVQMKGCHKRTPLFASFMGLIIVHT